MVGPEGTGKSTIARTVADTFAGKTRLIAGYVFKRGEKGGNDTTRLFLTLAMRLAGSMPPFQRCLRKSLDDVDKQAMEKKALANQFDALVRHPMEDLPPIALDVSQRYRVIIIIDGLDECECLGHLSGVLTLLEQLHYVNTTRLRVFLTSRSAPEIMNAFKSLNDKSNIRILHLHRAFPEDTKTDIRIFLEARFTEIKNISTFNDTPRPRSRT